ILAALGLIKVCDFIENHTRSAKRLFQRIASASIAFLLLTWLVDSLPSGMVGLCILSQLAHLSILRSSPSWPFQHGAVGNTSARAATARGFFSCGWLRLWLAFSLSFIAHFCTAHSFSALKQEWVDYHRPLNAHNRLPGGRLDWDFDPSRRPRTEEKTASEVVTFFALGVWCTPLLIFLGTCTAQLELPLGNRHGRSAYDAIGR
ncbi:hypothetical protein K437DRAFT_281779, partial [Tilletiaria anomala UBC 951]